MVVIEHKKKFDDHSMGDTAEAILGVVRQLAGELRSAHKRPLPVTLDTELDRELGFDSLSRVELLLRIERIFDVSLPEQVLASAETSRDLMRAVLHATAVIPKDSQASLQVAALGQIEGSPHTATTLIEMLDWHVRTHPQRPHIYLHGEGDTAEQITYLDLLDGARTIAAGLQQRALQPGQAVAIMLPTGRDYLFSFFGILLAGGIPVPIYPPVRLSQLEDHLRRHVGILGNAQTILLITMPEAQGVARLLKLQLEMLRSVVTFRELAVPDGRFSAPVIQAQDIAFLQYTSGSTGQPKGVILTHANLLANIRAMGEAVQADSSDVFVSWLPLYHDMGLIGAWLGSLYYAMPLVLMSPLTFLAHPRRWLWAIHNYRGTLSAAPNFAYELCLSKVRDADIEGLDLSSWRMAFNGAEPVSPDTVRHFSARFARFGFRPEAMAPVYGLAEAAVGLAFPPPGREPLIDRIQAGPFITSGKAKPAKETEASVQVFVACGQPLPGYQIRIVDAAGRELPERQEGRLQFRGPSATSGYLRNSVATESLFDGDWLDSADLAYIAGGDVYLTSRVKDIIIRAGRNIYPYEVEEHVGNIPGIRKGCVAIFGSPDPVSGTERVIIIAETREEEVAAREALHMQIRELATDMLDVPPDDIVLTPPHTVLKTSSGKIRRSAVRDLYIEGSLDQQNRAVWWQFVRIGLASLRSSLRRGWQRISSIAYASYAQLVFWLLAPPVWLLVALLPRVCWRWAVMRRGARLLFRLARVPLHVMGLEQLPRDQACVIVANHASYLDGVLLVTTLPLEFSFVAKGELDRQFIPRVFLRRINAQFVERFDTQRGLGDARHLAQTVRQGRSLMYFPEGTFTRIPGLVSFHMGAFVAAAEANVPVVPVTIRGMRSILRSDSWFAHRGAVSVIVGAPILPEGKGWTAAVKLRDAARLEILRHLGEPDLAGQELKPEA